MSRRLRRRIAYRTTEKAAIRHSRAMRAAYVQWSASGPFANKDSPLTLAKLRDFRRMIERGDDL